MSFSKILVPPYEEEGEKKEQVKEVEEEKEEKVKERNQVDSNDPLSIGEINQKQFDQLYIEATTNAAIRFRFAENMRNNEKMTVDIALIDYFRKDFKQTSSSIDVLCRKYLSTGWKEIGYSLLNKLAHSQYMVEDWPNYLISCLLFISKDSFGYSDQQKTFLSQFLEIVHHKLSSPLEMPRLSEIISPTNFIPINQTLSSSTPPPQLSPQPLTLSNFKNLPQIKLLSTDKEENKENRMVLEVGNRLQVLFDFRSHLIEPINFDKICIKWSKQFSKAVPEKISHHKRTLSSFSTLKDQDLRSSSSNSSQMDLSSPRKSDLPQESKFVKGHSSRKSIYASLFGKESNSNNPNSNSSTNSNSNSASGNHLPIDFSTSSNNINDTSSLSSFKNNPSSSNDKKSFRKPKLDYEKLEKEPRDENASLIYEIQMGTQKENLPIDDKESFEMSCHNFVVKPNSLNKIEFSEIVENTGDYVCNQISFTIGKLTLTLPLLQYSQHNSLQNNLNRKLIRINPTHPTFSLTTQSFPFYASPFVYQATLSSSPSPHPPSLSSSLSPLLSTFSNSPNSSSSSSYSSLPSASPNPSQSIRFTLHTNQDDHIIGSNSFFVFTFKEEWINLLNQSDLPIYLYSDDEQQAKRGEKREHKELNLSNLNKEEKELQENEKLMEVVGGACVRQNKLFLPDRTFHRNQKAVVYLPFSFSFQSFQAFKLSDQAIPIDFSVNFKYLKLRNLFSVENHFSIFLKQPFSIFLNPVFQNKENLLFLQLSLYSSSPLPLRISSHRLLLPPSIQLDQDHNLSSTLPLLSPNHSLSFSFVFSSHKSFQLYDNDLSFQFIVDYQFVNPSSFSLSQIHQLYLFFYFDPILFLFSIILIFIYFIFIFNSF